MYEATLVVHLANDWVGDYTLTGRGETREAARTDLLFELGEFYAKKIRYEDVNKKKVIRDAW